MADDAEVDEFIYPRRNLGAGEHWGRVVESRLDALLAEVGTLSQRKDGADRYANASAGDIARIGRETLALTEEVEAAILRQPTYFSSTATKTAFKTSEGWSTVASIRVDPPSGTTRSEVVATASVFVQQDESSGSGGYDFIVPFPWSTVTSEFGPRPPKPYHNGIDFGISGGTAIPSANTGRVILNDTFDDWGNYIRIDCSDLIGIPGSWIGYAHLQQKAPHAVGDIVTQGQMVGRVGSTGYSTGNHLHWETAPGGTRIDPRSFMDSYGGQTGATNLPVEARILIDGNTSLAYTTLGGGYRQHLRLTHGRRVQWGESWTGGYTVELQTRARGGAIAAKPANVAAITIKGGNFR